MNARHLLSMALIAMATSSGHAQTSGTQQQQQLPPPERPSNDEIRTARSLANTDWGKDLPAFSFALSKMPMTRYNGGAARQAGTYNFPVSRNIAGVYMTLDAGAIRELHWHADAAEWAYVIEGRSRITLTSPEGQVQIADVDAGGIWYFPRGWGHSIEGLGPN